VPSGHPRRREAWTSSTLLRSSPAASTLSEVTANDSRTIIFLDLSRFTALTDVHGDLLAARIADRFVEAVESLLSPDTRLVKVLGDGALIEAAEPAAAIELAAQVNARLHEAVEMPEFTGGIATGSVVDRGADILGATVNLAARLADLAPAGELRVTERVARAAASAGWHVEPLGPTEIRGLHEPEHVFRVRLCPPEWCVIDPVCGMRITPGADTPRSELGGRTTWFCSLKCAERFQAAPHRYEPIPDTRPRPLP
jgi:adenylate cyclase